MAVVGDIVERPTVAPAAMPTAPASRPTMMPSPWTAPRGGFPRVAHRSLGATTTTTRVPPLAPTARTPAPEEEEDEEEAGPQKRGSAAEGPTMHHHDHAGGASQQQEQQQEQQGERLTAQIHEENVRKLISMSSDEIAAAQAEIVQALDPRLLDMFRSRARRQPPLPPLHHPQQQQQQHGEQGAPAPVGKARSEEDGQGEELERAKMHWMHDMPGGGGDATASGGGGGLLHVDVGFVEPPARSASTASIHRFDFEGNLLPPDTQVPVHAGLHHHGKDQSRPGYTLEEVGILARSQMPSQRVIALRTLAHVARKLKSTRYPPPLSGTLARVFFKDIRLPLLLRTALDDSNATVVSSAVECLHALLVDPREEELYEVLWTTLRGVEAFPLLPDSTLPYFASAEGLVKADEETPDEDVARRDLVRGLLRMSLLPRLRYLLEVARLETAVVEGIFDVLIRIARHSPAAAHLVAECPRLWPCVRLLFIEVFPDKLSQVGGEGEGGDEGGAVAYVHPLPKAIELVRVLCQASRVLAERCVEEGLLDSLMRFVVGGTLVPAHAAHALFVEAVRAWTACALYGLHVHAFPTLFPHLLPHAALSNLSSPSALARSAAVLPLFHALTSAAAAAASSSDGEGAVAWAQVAGLTEAPMASLPALVSALVGALSSSSSSSSEHRVQAQAHAALPLLRALAAALHLMATHWDLAPHPTPTRQQQPRSQADNGGGGGTGTGDDETAVAWARPLLQLAPSLVPLLLSLAAAQSPRWRVAGEEDEVHHHRQEHQVPAAVVEEVGYPSRLDSYALHVGAADAVGALLRLLRALLHRAPSLARCVLLTDTVGWARQLLRDCLDHGLHQEALPPSAAAGTAKTAGHWRRLFAKRPLVLAAGQALLYLLAVEAVHLRGTAPQPHNGDGGGGGGGGLKAHEGKEEEEEERRWLLTCACQLLPRLPPGDYPYALQLVEEVVLQPRFLLLLGAASRAQEADEAAVGVCRTLAHFYAAALDPYVKSSLVAAGRTGGWRRDHLLVPVDESPELPLAEATAWMFLPVAHYHALLSLASRALPDEDDGDDNSHEEDVAPPPDLIKAALAFLTLLEQAAPAVMTAIPVATKCYELMKVFFLASGALVFDEAVAAPLRHLFGRYCPDLPYPTSAAEAISAAGLVAFEQEVPHFYGFFSRLVDHFSSSSYGHPVFARALWLLLDMRQPPQYRTLLWTELLDSLHLLHLPESEVPVGRHWYLYPAENDPEMVRLYEAALTSPRGLSAVRSPTLYAVAIHHVATHLFALPAPAPFPPAPAASSASSSSSSSWQRVLLLQRLLDDASSETCVRDLCFYEPWAGEGPLLPDRAAGRSASDVRPAVRELLEAAASSSPAVRKRLQEISLLL